MLGKTDSYSYIELLSDYGRRIQKYLPFELHCLPDAKNTRNLSEELQKEKEGESILNFFKAGDCIVLLDEKGTEYTSVDFAGKLEKNMAAGYKRIVFVIGGPYGFSKSVYDAASEKIALSRMTFPHQLVRLIFIEQLYRALTILKGEPYHHT
jgi:23S rRNA (pseudouridine1915-N3)-methyltransferase